MGDLKLVEKPQPVVLAPHDFCNIKASVKVASTENGIIFGNIGKIFKVFSYKYCINYLLFTCPSL
jgi:vesicle coat complex subunit